MASSVQIAKLALQHVGDRYDITSLDEATPEAEQVNLLFDDVRDMVLRQHPWKFAVKHDSPAQLAGTVPGLWTYMFTYPSDCLKMIEIVNPLGKDADPIEFDVMLNSGGAKVVVCDVEEPEFRYISRVTDSARFDPSFVMAFSLRLAQFLAVPLTGDRGLAEALRNEADRMMSMARADDANEGVEDDHRRDASWIEARA